MMSENDFSELQQMIQQENFVQALESMLNMNTGRIRPPFSKDLNHAWYLVGLIYYKCDDLVQALRAFKTSLRNWREDPQAMNAISYCYSELGKPKLAEKYLRKALSIDPDNQSYIYNLGNALYDQQKYELAILEYKNVTKAGGEIYDLSKKNILNSKEKIKLKDGRNVKRSITG